MWISCGQGPEAVNMDEVKKQDGLLESLIIIVVTL